MGGFCFAYAEICQVCFGDTCIWEIIFGRFLGVQIQTMWQLFQSCWILHISCKKRRVASIAIRIKERWGDVAVGQQEHDTFAAFAQQMRSRFIVRPIKLVIYLRLLVSAISVAIFVISFLCFSWRKR